MIYYIFQLSAIANSRLYTFFVKEDEGLANIIEKYDIRGVLFMLI